MRKKVEKRVDWRNTWLSDGITGQIPDSARTICTIAPSRLKMSTCVSYLRLFRWNQNPHLLILIYDRIWYEMIWNDMKWYDNWLCFHRSTGSSYPVWPSGCLAVSSYMCLGLLVNLKHCDCVIVLEMVQCTCIMSQRKPTNETRRWSMIDNRGGACLLQITLLKCRSVEALEGPEGVW